ncbi:MAG: hypothetical protein ABJN57_07810 [Hyphomicrobiales bacterium]
MEKKYKISKIKYLMFSLVTLLLFLPFYIVPWFYLDVFYLKFFIDYSPVYLITLMFLYIFYRFSKYFWGGYVFEIKEDGIHFVDGTIPIEFEFISKIEKKAALQAVGRNISFELKPEHRKIRFRHFPIFFSIGGKRAFISFYYLSGGNSDFCKLYDELTKRQNNYS